MYRSLPLAALLVTLALIPSPRVAASSAALLPSAEPLPEAHDDPAPAPAFDAVADADGVPLPRQEPLVGPARPALILSQAWFVRPQGRIKPGPARLQIWRQGDGGEWAASFLEDADSNVFHQATPVGDGLVTLGAEGALLKRWTPTADGWDQETLWEREWGGRFDRLREMEIGDVDGDGVDEWVIATHDQGVVAIYQPDDGSVIELNETPDLFAHEIELGDTDGDGRLEIFATLTERNTATGTRSGTIARYQWDGAGYARDDAVVDELAPAKEILAVDLDGDGRDELIAVREAETSADRRQINVPVQILAYAPDGDGGFAARPLAEIHDRMARFLVPGDFDGDGDLELVVAAYRAGLFLLDRGADGAWAATSIDELSSGFEHACRAVDLDGDGRPELYVAADDQRELRRYVWSGGGFERETLGRLEEDSITWQIAAGVF